MVADIAATLSALATEPDMLMPVLLQKQDRLAASRREVEALEFRLEFLESAGTEAGGWCEHERRYQRTSGGDGDHCYVCEVEALKAERDEARAATRGAHRVNVAMVKQSDQKHAEALDICERYVRRLHITENALAASRAEASRLREWIGKLASRVCMCGGVADGVCLGCAALAALSPPAPADEDTP